MKLTTDVLDLISGVLSVLVFVWLVGRMIKSHFEDTRHQQGIELVIQLHDLVIDNKIDEKEASHLVNQLHNPTPACLTMVRDRIEEIKEPLMLQ